PTESHHQAWSQLWDQGDSHLWDRGRPPPALVEVLERRDDLLAPTTEDDEGRSKGCGRGYDVLALALHGFDAYGLEISPTAVSPAEEYVSDVLETGLSDFDERTQNQIVKRVLISIKHLELYRKK
ncbi:MAG: hypothetical protein M1830_004858, partial [Pleopsidium flavum]